MVAVPFELLLLSALATSPLTLASAKPIEKSTPSLNDLMPQIHSPSDQQRLTPDTHPPTNPPPRTSDTSYKCYGPHPSTYPPPSSWLPFPTLWDLNRETILSANAGDVYIQHDIHTALLTVSTESNIDARFLLALLLQETSGRASTPCTGPTPRCGLLHSPKGSLFNPSHPYKSILRMLRDGVHGSARRGPGLHDLLIGKPKFAGVEVGDYWSVARAYESGEVREGDLEWVRRVSGKGKGERGFVNDVANRVMGWDGRGEGFEGCEAKRVEGEGRELEWYYPAFLADL